MLQPPAARTFSAEVWRRFVDERDSDGFLDHWLAYQVTKVAGCRNAWLFAVDTVDEAPEFSLLAVSPADLPDEGRSRLASPDVTALLADAATSGEGQSGEAEDPDDAAKDVYFVAMPLRAAGRVQATVLMELSLPDLEAASEAQREQFEALALTSAQLEAEWGGGWVVDWLNHRRGARSAETRTAAPIAPPPERGALGGADEIFQIFAGVVEAPRYRDAAMLLVTRLAEHFGLERASMGEQRGRRAKVIAMSHAAYAHDRMDEVRRLQAAMDEALDQNAAVSAPPGPEARTLVVREHEALAAAGGGLAVLTFPLTGAAREAGALTLERREPFSPAELAALEAAARLAGPVLVEKRRNDRSIFVKVWASMRDLAALALGPRRPMAKIGLGLAAAGLASIIFLEQSFEIRAAATLEASSLRVVAAPFDGYLDESLRRAGDSVAAGDALARFDTADLLLEQTSLIADRNQAAVRFEEATAEYKPAEAKVHRARVAQIDAQLALVETRLSRAEIRAPFDGLIVSGDLSQSIGEPIETGRELFELAPSGSYRMVLGVDEVDIAHISAGQTGAVVLAALPDETFAFEVERVTPVLSAAEGRNFYRVEAALTDPKAADAAGFRPGLEGRARIKTGTEPIIWVWTRDLTRWVRLQLWAWTP